MQFMKIMQVGSAGFQKEVHMIEFPVRDKRSDNWWTILARCINLQSMILDSIFFENSNLAGHIEGSASPMQCQKPEKVGLALRAT